MLHTFNFFPLRVDLKALQLGIRSSYTLKYTVFNATLNVYFLFILRHVSAALGNHQVFCCQSCLIVIYI
jgi:hypothetical protein